MSAMLCYATCMAQTVCPFLSVEDRQRLAAVLADRNRPQKHVARARIILHSAERLDVAEVARRAQISRPAVWRWQQRFAEAGVDGLMRDKTRKPGKPPTPEAVVQRGFAKAEKILSVNNIEVIYDHFYFGAQGRLARVPRGGNRRIARR